MCSLSLIGRSPLLSSYLFDEALVFRSLQHHLATSKFQERERVNEFLYKSLAGISTPSEVLSSVR